MIGAQTNVLDYRADVAGTKARADSRGLVSYGIGIGSRKRASPAQGLDRFLLLGCMPGNQCRLRGLSGHDRERRTFTLERSELQSSRAASRCYFVVRGGEILRMVEQN